MTTNTLKEQIPRLRAAAWVTAALVGAFVGLYYAVRHLGLLGLAGGVGVAGGLLATAVNPLAPFSLYFGALFFADTRIPAVPLSVNQVLAPLFFLSWVAFFLRGRTVRLESRFVGVLAVVSLLFAISAITGEDFERGVVHCRYVVIYFLMALALASCLSTERSVYALAWIVVVATVIAAAVGLAEGIQKNVFDAFTGRWTDAQRIKGTAKNSIVYGWNLLYAFPFAFLLFSQIRRPAARYLALAAGLFILGIAVLTFNRQTFVLIGFLGLACAALFQYRDRKAFLGISLAAGVVGGILLLPALIGRLTTLGNVSRDASYIDRRDQFLVAWEMFSRHPLTGIGLGSYPGRWRQYLPADYSTYDMQYQGGPVERFPDSGYMQLLAETGLIGLGVVLLLMGYLIWRAWRSRAEARVRGDQFAFNFATLVLVLAMYWTVSNLIQDTFLYVRVWIVFGLAVLVHPRILFGESQGDATALEPAGESP